MNIYFPQPQYFYESCIVININQFCLKSRVICTKRNKTLRATKTTTAFLLIFIITKYDPLITVRKEIQKTRKGQNDDKVEDD